MEFAYVTGAAQVGAAQFAQVLVAGVVRQCLVPSGEEMTYRFMPGPLVLPGVKPELAQTSAHFGWCG